MPAKQEKIKKRFKHNFKIIGWALMVIIIFGLYLTQNTIDFVYGHRILPGVIIGEMSLGGLTVKEAWSQLQTRVNELQKIGLTFCNNGQCVVVDSISIAPDDPDLSYELFSTDISQLITKASRQGREGGLIKRLLDQFQLIKNQTKLKLDWQIDNEKILDILKSNFGEKENPAVNADINIKPMGAGYKVGIIPAKTGWRFDYETALKEALFNLGQLKNQTITLKQITDKPRIAKIPNENLIKLAETILRKNKWQLTFNDNKWPLSKKQVAKSLTLRTIDGTVAVGLATKAFDDLLIWPRDELEQPARDAKFKLVENRVVEFQSSQDGIIINTEATLKTANELISQATSSWELNFPLIIEVASALTPTESVNDLGIKELIGVGTSNFSGSPKNRRHNIRVGANALNGLLIPPDEEFSLIKALGRVDGESGYLQELVIKGNKTIPEYGGGLCQIGTTTFRVALASGLPIIERQNHSYRVSYYEPAGTDATIYSPKPDFRFKNDTENYILIQTFIKGDELIFEFWGTQDGRITSQTKPIIYNITSPPPTKYIETADLQPGVIKCTERAHKGADTSFDYLVTYMGEETKKTTFVSHYRPWQEVCLIGVNPEDLINEEELAEET